MKKKQTKKTQVTVARGVTLPRGKESRLKEKAGSSNTGKYKTVSPKSFAGASGGASRYSYPIDNIGRGRNALSRAHFAPNPEGIKEAVYRKYPQLKKKSKTKK